MLSEMLGEMLDRLTRALHCEQTSYFLDTTHEHLVAANQKQKYCTQDYHQLLSHILAKYTGFDSFSKTLSSWNMMCQS